MESPRMRRIAVVSLKTVICAAILIGLLYLMGARFETGVARAASNPPFADAGLSQQGAFGAQDAWQGGPMGYWEPKSQQQCDKFWILNPKPGKDGKPKYIQTTLCHWLSAWIPTPAPAPYGGQILSDTPSYYPAGAETWNANPAAYPYGVAPNRCFLGTIRLHVNQKIDVGPASIDTGQTLYWANYHQKVCSTNAGHIYWASGLSSDARDGDTGTLGAAIGWSGPAWHDSGAKQPDSNTYNSHIYARFKQAIDIAHVGVRFRTIDHLLKGHWVAGVQGAQRGIIAFYPNADHAWCNGVGC